MTKRDRNPRRTAALLASTQHSRRATARVAPAFALLAALIASTSPAAAERLVSSLSNHRVMVTSNFTGDEVVLFGGIEQDANSRPRRGGYDIVVTVTGPRQTLVTFRKSRVLGIWVNTEASVFEKAPTYLAVLSNRPLDDITSTETLQRLQLGLDNFPLPQRGDAGYADGVGDDSFRAAFVKIRTRPWPLSPGVERRHVLNARTVPRVDPAAGRRAGGQLRCRCPAVRRRRDDCAHAIRT